MKILLNFRAYLFAFKILPKSWLDSEHKIISCLGSQKRLAVYLYPVFCNVALSYAISKVIP